MIRAIGALVGAVEKAERLAQSDEARLNDVAASVRGRRKPKVYFEEWDNPLISGIGWVSELIEIAGGEDVFPELRKQKAAKDRIVCPTSLSPLGAARRSFRARSGNDPAGMRSRRYWNDHIVEELALHLLQCRTVKIRRE